MARFGPIHAKRSTPEDGGVIGLLSDAVRHSEAEIASDALLRRMNEQFEAAAKRAHISFADARLLLMNGVAA